MKTTIYFSGKRNLTLVQKTTFGNITRVMVVYSNGVSESNFIKK